VGAGMARDFVGDEPFLLTFGDIMTPGSNYAALVRAYEQDPDSAYICVNPARDVSSGGAVFVRDGRVVDIIEKPPVGTVDTSLINSGIFIMRPQIFDVIDDLAPSARGEYELTTALVRTIHEGTPTAAHELRGYWSNVGGPDQVLWLTRLLLQRMAAAQKTNGGPPRAPGRLEGAVFLGRNVSIHPNAEITGPVFVGDDCQIGEACVGRYTTLGRECSIGDGSQIVSSAVFAETTIGENCQVGHALLGSGVQVDSDAWLVGTSGRAAVVEDNHRVAVDTGA